MKISILCLFLLTWGSNLFAQDRYAHDRVYTANQVSNSVSVIDPATNTFLGEIKLGKAYPNVLNPLYTGQTLVHGLRYCPQRKMLAVVSIGSNSVTLISTETNAVLKTIYIGRSPHEPTFTPDGKQVWVSVRGESYLSIIDVDEMKEIRQVTVANGPGMVSFSPDGKFAYICSSFTPELDIINTATYAIVKKIPVVSPFSPNIFTSPDGKWIAMTHKDVGKVTIISAATQSVVKVINTGPITNHVTFCNLGKKQLMLVTVGGENKVRIFDVAAGFKQTDTLMVGALPHGIWPSGDGKIAYVGMEYGDQVQRIELETMTTSAFIQIGQSPQALVYADNAVSDMKNIAGLEPLSDTSATRVIELNAVDHTRAHGHLAVRSIGVTELVEQIFTLLKPGSSYTLALSHSVTPPFKVDYEINSFITDGNGRYVGQSSALIKSSDPRTGNESFKHLILVDAQSGALVLIDFNSISNSMHHK
jgi:YVTN family beta-propeller protein